MREQETALRWAFTEEHVSITRHARIQMSVRALVTDDVIAAGRSAEVLEEDRSRSEGATKVLLGSTGSEEPIHLVVNVEAFEADHRKRVRLVTAYRPEPPEWADERTRGMGQ